MYLYETTRSVAYAPPSKHSVNDQGVISLSIPMTQNGRHASNTTMFPSSDDNFKLFKFDCDVLPLSAPSTSTFLLLKYHGQQHASQGRNSFLHGL